MLCCLRHRSTFRTRLSLKKNNPSRMIAVVSQLILAYLFLSTDASVHTAGNYLVMTNYVIPSSPTHTRVEMDRRIDCELKCTEDVNCKQYSWIQRSPGIYCNMAGKYNETLVYEEHPLGATAIYTGTGGRVMIDGNMYIVMPPRADITDRGKEECKKHGFRLAEFNKPELFEALLKYGSMYPEEKLSVNLEKVDGKVMWGGNIEASSSVKDLIEDPASGTDPKYIYFSSSKFHFEEDGVTYSFLCQKIM